MDGDHNNFGPRLGFAWQGTRKFVLRGGAGIFYGERDQNQQVTQFSGNLPNVPVVSLPSVSATQTVAPPFTINTPITVVPTDPSLASFTPAKPFVGTIRSQGFHDARDPMLYQFNLDIQYQATSSLLLEASYSGALGHDLSSLFINVNQIPFSQALVGLNKQANRPFPNINGTVIPTFSNATNDYNAVNFRVEKRYAKGLALLVNYTIQKNLESGGAGPDAYKQNGGTSIAMDTYNIARERSVAPIDVPQIFTASVAYELPFGAGKSWLAHGVRGQGRRRLAGQYDRIAARRLSDRYPHQRAPADFQHVQCAGPCVGPTDGGGQLERGQLFQSRRLHGSGHGPRATRARPSSCSATPPAASRAGRVRRTLDVSVFKNIRFYERTVLQFRAEFFNFTNTPTFFLPAASSPTLTCMGPSGGACNASNPSFGKLTSGSATGRQIQFGLKLYF